MVDTGIVQKLLELLDRHIEEGNVTVQHAALSALRNLAIPGELSAQPEDWSHFKHTVCGSIRFDLYFLLHKAATANDPLMETPISQQV